jgi:hypothetical protein
MNDKIEIYMRKVNSILSEDEIEDERCKYIKRLRELEKEGEKLVEKLTGDLKLGVEFKTKLDDLESYRSFLYGEEFDKKFKSKISDNFNSNINSI